MEVATEGTGGALNATAQKPTPGTTATPTSGVSPKGQPDGTARTTQQGTTAAGDEESFFDPKTLDEKLLPAYKQMQKAFSKKMEDIKSSRQKIQAFDDFSKDPLSQIQQMASRMGYKLTRAEAAEIQANNQDGIPQKSKSWEPQTWDEVMARAKQEVLKELSPVLDEFKSTRKHNIEKMLDDTCPDWRQYEDEMQSTLQQHPSLVKDPVKLYRLSVPDEVLESRATQAALKKLQAKVDASKVQGQSTTTTRNRFDAAPKMTSFQEAVAFARTKLAEDGIRP